MRTYSLNYILAFFLGLQELGSYRLIQLLYTPLTLIFGVYESYIHKQYQNLNQILVTHSSLKKSLDKEICIYNCDYILFCCNNGVLIVFFGEKFRKRYIFDVALCSILFCGPFIIIYAIYIRFLKKSKNLLKIYLKEFSSLLFVIFINAVF